MQKKKKNHMHTNCDTLNQLGTSLSQIKNDQTQSIVSFLLLTARNRQQHVKYLKNVFVAVVKTF